jgi:hypothetical protein
MMLADRLKKSISEIMELTTLELDLWSMWIKKEQDAANRQTRRSKISGNKRSR